MQAAVNAPIRLQEGSVVCGGYMLERLLRRDEVVSVYLARAAGDGHPRHVARVVHGVRPADERRAVAFEEAATRIAELWPRATPRLTAVGVSGVEPVTVAERVHAATLRDLVREPEGLGPREFGLAILRVAEALDVLHSLSPAVVHRRLSPDNILVSGAGEVWVEESGLAHALVEAGWSPTSVAPAAVEYVTPQESLHRIHPQTDIFALATIAYECLTGLVPFAGDRSVVRAAVLEQDRPSLVAQRPDLSRNIDAVLLRAWSSEGCGALEPYPSAEAFARDLLRVLDGGGRAVSPDAVTVPPPRAATAPPRSPEDAVAHESGARAPSLADLAAAIPPPEPLAGEFVAHDDVSERFTDPPPATASAPSDVRPIPFDEVIPEEPTVVRRRTLPPAETAAEPPSAPARSARSTMLGIGGSPTLAAATTPGPTSVIPPASASVPPASASVTPPASASVSPASASVTPPASASVLPASVSVPPASASVTPPASASVTPPASASVTPPAESREVAIVHIPTISRSSEVRASPSRVAIPANLGPSLVGVAAILAAAWVYTNRPPPASTDLVQQSRALRSAESAPIVSPAPAPPAVAPPAPAPPAPAPLAVAPPAVAPPAVAPPAVARPPQPELNATRTILQGTIEGCLAGRSIPSVQVQALYAGATGRPRVRILTPMTDIEAAACIERSIIELPLRPFGAGNWPVRYTFTAR